MKPVDLTDRTFGKLRVLKKADITQCGHTVWECECECGNVVSVMGSSLTSGKTKSCGCNRFTRKNTLVGMTFGMVTVVERIGDYVSDAGWHDAVYLCKCECGNTFTQRRFALTRNDVPKTCGCKRFSKRQQNLKNRRFGMLVALNQVEDYTFKNGRKEPQWLYKCDCGNEVVLRNVQVLRENKQSCGCEVKPLPNDLTGRTFGKLEVLERDLERKSKRVYYICKCECGTVKSILGQNLLSNETISCGCMKQSRLEYTTQSVLESMSSDNSKANLFDSYITQFKDDSLVGTRGGKLRFDFALIKNDRLIALIECNGQQHYEPVPHFGGQQTFARQIENDSRKAEYAVSKKVPLIIVPYTSTSKKKVSKIIMDALAS